MSRDARSEIYRPEEVAVVHVMAKTVRSIYLFGTDELTEKCYDHRRDWIEKQLIHQAKYFGIDLLANAIMSNHFHLVLCSRPDVVSTWDDTEVANRWLHLCPKRKDALGNPQEPNERELDSIRTKPEEVKKIRSRLSDISWWMRLCCQKIAQRANYESGENGRFFNGRFKATRLLDEQSILACMIYVDLNPIRAGIAVTVETSSHTSIIKRIKAMNELNKQLAERSDAHLRPIEIKQNEDGQVQVAVKSKDQKRCSNKGVLEVSIIEYFKLADYTARLRKIGKVGYTPASLPPILERIGFDLKTWESWTSDFGSLFSQAAGTKASVTKARTLGSNRKIYCPAYHTKRS